MVARGLFYFYGLSGEEVTSDNSSFFMKGFWEGILYFLIGKHAIFSITTIIHIRTTIKERRLIYDA